MEEGGELRTLQGHSESLDITSLIPSYIELSEVEIIKQNWSCQIWYARFLALITFSSTLIYVEAH